ncbi:MAG: hypothetical protein LBD68_01940 [Zoogloeaceae bacterium]|jgi:hypothetical protein|nr:hypothetical protein [Zoogloeaceae bacterium]
MFSAPIAFPPPSYVLLAPPFAPGGGQASASAGESAAARQGVGRGDAAASRKTSPELPGQVDAPERAEKTRTEKEKESEGARAPGEAGKANGEALSAEERREVAELAATDNKVRQHEMAHIAAGGELVTSGARYEYQQGPDGKRYAVAGEVGIDTSEGRTPEETVIRARRIRAAALAPADPSPQDRSVAAAATQMEIHAQQEIALNRRKEQQGVGTENVNASSSRAQTAQAATSAYQGMSAIDGGQKNRFSAYA